MRLTVDCQELYKAIARISKPTSSASSVTLETDSNDKLIVHRYSALTYAESEVMAEIEEPGRVAVGNMQALAYLFGRASVYSTDRDLIIEGDGIPHTEFRRRQDDFLDTRMRFSGDLSPLPGYVKSVKWAALPGHPKFDYVFFSGHYVGCWGDVYTSHCRLDEPATDEVVAAPVGLLDLFGESPSICPEDKHLWFVDTDIKVRFGTIESSDWLGVNAPKLDEMAESMPRLICDKSVLLNALGYLQTVSQSKINLSGLGYLSFGNGSFRLEGQKTEEVSGDWPNIPAETEGEGGMSIAPAQVIKAISAVDDDKVTVGISGNMLIVTGGHIVNAIMKLSDNWRKE